MEAAQESDDVRPTGRPTRQLDRGLDRFGAAVAEIGPCAALEGRESGESLAQLGVDRQIEVGCAEVDELGGLACDRVDDLRVRVAGRGDRDARGEIEKEVAVDVLDGDPLTANRNDRIRPRETSRGPRLVVGDVGACLGAGDLGDDVRNRAISGDAGRDGGQAAPRRIGFMQSG
jgi:hypothetical protein